MSGQNRRFLFLLALLSLALITPANIHLRAFPTEVNARQPVSRLFPVEERSSADLLQDDQLETLELSQGQARLYKNGKLLWQSSPDWQVRQAAFSDLNQDGQTELALLVWRPFEPWLVDQMLPRGGRINNFQDADGFSCHLILIGWKLGALRELWAGSPLVDPLQYFAAVDLNGDGRESLVALEGRYDDPPNRPAWALSVWEWNGFGFSREERQQGNFVRIQPVRNTPGEIFLLVQTR